MLSQPQAEVGLLLSSLMAQSFPQEITTTSK